MVRGGLWSITLLSASDRTLDSEVPCFSRKIIHRVKASLKASLLCSKVAVLACNLDVKSGNPALRPRASSSEAETATITGFEFGCLSSEVKALLLCVHAGRVRSIT